MRGLLGLGAMALDLGRVHRQEPQPAVLLQRGAQALYVAFTVARG
jgi:hypothetical protein